MPNDLQQLNVAVPLVCAIPHTPTLYLQQQPLILLTVLHAWYLTDVFPHNMLQTPNLFQTSYLHTSTVLLCTVISPVSGRMNQTAVPSGYQYQFSIPVCVGISGDQLLWPVALRNKLPAALCRLFLFNYLPDVLHNTRLHQPQNMQFMYSGAPNPLFRAVNRHSVDSGRAWRPRQLTYTIICK